MKTYETKLGTATITSGRTLVKGQWGVLGKLTDGRECFLGFAGKPELEEAFPAPEVVKCGKRTEAIYDKMEKENSIY